MNAKIHFFSEKAFFTLGNMRNTVENYSFSSGFLMSSGFISRSKISLSTIL